MTSMTMAIDISSVKVASSLGVKDHDFAISDDFASLLHVDFFNVPLSLATEISQIQVHNILLQNLNLHIMQFKN